MLILQALQPLFILTHHSRTAIWQASYTTVYWSIFSCLIAIIA